MIRTTFLLASSHLRLCAMNCSWMWLCILRSAYCVGICREPGDYSYLFGLPRLSGIPIWNQNAFPRGLFWTHVSR